mmetsp:Transcript_9010/g.21951  ORF Transcript_9010/g.21951 Transcript_9010/m.21951 type:complete len:247 (-) Transcript_9010:1192-1932(-)
MSEYPADLGVKVFRVGVACRVGLSLARRRAVHVPLHPVGPLEEIALFVFGHGALVKLSAGVRGRLRGQDCARLVVARAEGARTVVVVEAGVVVAPSSIIVSALGIVIETIVSESTTALPEVVGVITIVRAEVVIVALPERSDASSIIVVIVVTFPEGGTSSPSRIIGRIRAPFVPSVGRRRRGGVFPAATVRPGRRAIVAAAKIVAIVVVAIVAVVVVVVVIVVLRSAVDGTQGRPVANALIRLLP